MSLPVSHGKCPRYVVGHDPVTMVRSERDPVTPILGLSTFHRRAASGAAGPTVRSRGPLAAFPSRRGGSGAERGDWGRAGARAGAGAVTETGRGGVCETGMEGAGAPWAGAVTGPPGPQSPAAPAKGSPRERTARILRGLARPFRGSPFSPRRATCRGPTPAQWRPAPHRPAARSAHRPAPHRPDPRRAPHRPAACSAPTRSACGARSRV